MLGNRGCAVRFVSGHADVRPADVNGYGQGHVGNYNRSGFEADKRMGADFAAFVRAKYP
jgi:hypothetical protein